MTTPRRAPHHDTYHRPRRPWFFYYQEDSARGIQAAVDEGKAWIDLDCQVTADGVLVIAHGPRPLGRGVLGGFADPEAKLDALTGHPRADEVKPRDKFEDLTWAQVSRLRSRRIAPDGHPWRIRRADELVPMALRKGLKVELEMKSSKITAAQLRLLWLRIRAAESADTLPKERPTRALRDDVQVKGFPKFLPALHAAHDAGYVTIALTHPGQRRLPASARAWLDYWRGRPPIWDGKR